MGVVYNTQRRGLCSTATRPLVQQEIPCEHEEELADYRAAKASINDLLGGAKLPKMDVLKEQRRKLAGRKGTIYRIPGGPAGYAGAVAVKTNIDHLIGATGSGIIRNRSDSL
jgi:hypothetical protein